MGILHWKAEKTKKVVSNLGYIVHIMVFIFTLRIFRWLQESPRISSVHFLRSLVFPLPLFQPLLVAPSFSSVHFEWPNEKVLPEMLTLPDGCLLVPCNRL